MESTSSFSGSARKLDRRRRGTEERSPATLRVPAPALWARHLHGDNLGKAWVKLGPELHTKRTSRRHNFQGAVAYSYQAFMCCRDLGIGWSGGVWGVHTGHRTDEQRTTTQDPAV